MWYRTGDMSLPRKSSSLAGVLLVQDVPVWANAFSDSAGLASCTKDQAVRQQSCPLEEKTITSVQQQEYVSTYRCFPVNCAIYVGTTHNEPFKCRLQPLTNVGCTLAHHVALGACPRPWFKPDLTTLSWGSKLLCIDRR